MGRKSSLVSCLIFLSVILSFIIVNADVISINSGGSEDIVVTSDPYIEGFFSCVPQTCSDLGFNCGTAVEACGLTLSCGTCGSGETCTNNICVADDDDAGGGGGGGGGGTTAPQIDVSPLEFNINLQVNTNVEEVITVANTGSSATTVGISQSNLDGMVILENSSIELSPGEVETFNVIFVASDDPGVYTGTINIGSTRILVSLNVQSQLLLFDSNIVVLNEDYLVEVGDDLLTQVTLLPLGDRTRIDLILNYEIKDFNGETFLTASEAMLIENEVSFRKNFDTGSLPLGDYVVALELVYPNGVAPSSASFKVIERTGFSLGTFLFFLSILILIIGIIILAILMYRLMKKRREERQGMQPRR